jgi:hypothetical protein
VASGPLCLAYGPGGGGPRLGGFGGTYDMATSGEGAVRLAYTATPRTAGCQRPFTRLPGTVAKPPAVGERVPGDWHHSVNFMCMVRDLVLGGGGSASQERELWRPAFADVRKVVYWPFACWTNGLAVRLNGCAVPEPVLASRLKWTPGSRRSPATIRVPQSALRPSASSPASRCFCALTRSRSPASSHGRGSRTSGRHSGGWRRAYPRR